jgi:hypothetical protein
MHVSIYQLPHTSSFSGAQLSKGYVVMVWHLVKHRDITWTLLDSSSADSTMLIDILIIEISCKVQCGR